MFTLFFEIWYVLKVVATPPEVGEELVANPVFKTGLSDVLGYSLICCKVIKYCT